MKLLVVTPFLPTPVNAGNCWRLVTVLEALGRMGHTVDIFWLEGLAAQTGWSAPLGALPAADPLWRLVREVTSYVHPRRAGGFAKAAHYVRRGLEKARGRAIVATETFCPRGFARAAGVRARAGGYDAVIAEYVYVMPVVDELPPGLPVLCDTLDCLSARALSQAKQGAARDLARIEREEARWLGRARAILAVSESDAACFRRLAPGVPAVVVPIPPRVGKSAPSAAEGDPLVIFVGWPNDGNVDGGRWFLAEIWPRVRAALPGARFRVVGKVADALRGAPGANPAAGVDLAGYVDDLAQEYERATLVVSPLRIGSGVKVKVLEAMGHGRAQVVTSTAAEGLPRGANTALEVRDEAASFADAVVDLARDHERRSAMETRAGTTARSSGGALVDAALAAALKSAGDLTRDGARPS